MEKKKILERFIRAVELDGDALPGKTLIEIVGNRSALIENHCGVIAYNTRRVTVKTKQGCLTVTGCDLLLQKMSRDMLRITGRIFDVALKEMGNSGR